MFEGKIDEVHVRSAAVYAFDPMEDYTPDADTLGLWHFDETSGTTAYEDDTEGTKQNATVPSGAWSVNDGEFGVGSYAREYAYDKVGNRTEMRLYDEDANFSRDIEWTLEYNDLNQLTKRYVGASWSVGTHRIEYDYDANGNLIGSVEETYSGVWSVSEEWQYDWNPRDQMTRAMKWAGSSGSTNNVGSVEYQYCLACDGALSKRFVYAGGSGATRGALQSGQRYEYDGLNLLRVDEIYGSTLSETGPWRTLEISTHQPGQIGALLHKRVYIHTDNDATPDQTKDFTYSYDPVGNVYSVFDSNGNEAYYFTQDAFGNKLPIATLGGDNWDAARADRVVEHQTGKWIDEFTGLYYFHARWYDSGVGRFVGRANVRPDLEMPYDFCKNNPTFYSDPAGTTPSAGDIITALLAVYAASQGLCALAASVPGLIEAKIGERLGIVGEWNKWPRTHCMWNCFMEKWCGPGTAEMASFLKEVMDLAVCFINGDPGHCWSAFQDGDWRDNAAGREAAKRYRCCAEGCKRLGAPLGCPERDRGPFYDCCANRRFCME